MADKSLFGRLKKLFNTQVVVRRIGKGRTQTIDTQRLQSQGNLRGSSYYDRFGRLHTTRRHWETYNNQFNYHSNKLELYTDYEAMDKDSIIASVLDIYSDECTLKNDMGDVLRIKSNDENIKKILHNLFYDVLNIEFNLWSWIRGMNKYGDYFLHLDIEEGVGIVNASPLSAYELEREEGFNPENPYEVRFKLGAAGAAHGVAANRPDDYFEFYQVAHFRLMADTNFLPYGRSLLEGARKTWKQLTLMEDAMMIHRIMRAPEKRVFYMNVGGIPPNEIDSYMEKTVAKMKKTPYIDQQTGDYNLKFNIQNMTEDFYIPVRGNDSSTKIETTKGLDYDGTTDIEYLKNRMLAALKIPKAFLGYDENLEGKSTLAAMDIRFARTIERLQRTIVSELHKIALVHLYTQGFTEADLVDFELELTGPSIVFEQEKTQLYTEKVALANSITDKKILSTDFVYKNIFNLSDKEIEHERNRALDDAAHIFRLNQIENEGNDPIESGESYGTPHDLANLYSTKRDKTIKDVPDGYDEEKPGRPAIKFSRYDTDQANMGRDPLGKAGLTADDTPNRTNDVSTFALEENSRILKKLSLTRLNGKKVLTETNKNSLLDEENIINE